MLLLGYFTYVHNYANPAALFWDENFHIAAAQKYQNDIFFMEPHPPLGKLLIAAGEHLLNENEFDNQYIDTDYARDLPPVAEGEKPFSFAGYRLFPTLAGWLTTIVLFGIFLFLTRGHGLFATLLTFPLIFDNAMIVHSRGAMLDSTMLFFGSLCILAFLLILQPKKPPWIAYAGSALFGISFAAVMTTKVLGLILILLVPLLAIALRKELRKLVMCILCLVSCFLLAYVSIWNIHFSLGKTLNPSLSNGGTYEASDAYIDIVNGAGGPFLAQFYIQWYESTKFVKHYSGGVPELDLCKADENGSPYFLWPIGSRTISYRWETPGDDKGYQYLYLISNPVGWGLGLLGILGSFCLIGAWLFLPLRQKIKNLPLIATFLMLWLCYMIAVSQLDRVMYLYHYFLPLLFSYILFGLVVLEIKKIGPWKATESVMTNVLLLCGLLIFVAHLWIRPLTYYQLLTHDEFDQRKVLKLWEMRCATCSRDSIIVNGSNLR